MSDIFDPARAFDFLILPGLGNSGVDHWQSHWSMAFPNATRVLQDNWDAPEPAAWLARLDTAIAGGVRPAVLIAHSLGTVLSAHWAARGKPGRVKAAFLVAPSDVESPAHTPDEVRSFAPMPRLRFPVPALVMASQNDPYVTLERANVFAADWGAEVCNAGELGHINSASRLGLWPQGLLQLGRLLAKIERN